MNSCAEESDYSSSSDGVEESRQTTTTTEEETDSRNISQVDALSILKHCDAATLEKLCGTLSNSTDSTVAYANFPKRSLVKCFSARDKYEWHMAQTAELEDLVKKWEGVEQQIRQRNKTRHKRRVSSSREGGSESRMRDSTYPEFIMDGSSRMVLMNSASKPRQGTSRRKLRRPSPHHQNKTPSKETPSPLIVNEDILQEALTIAENVQISDDSDLPSPLSSCLKTQSDSSEADFDANKRHPSVFKARTNEAPGLVSEPITTGLSATEALEHSFSFHGITSRPSGRAMNSNGVPPRRKSHERSTDGTQGPEKVPQPRGSGLTMTEQQMHDNNSNKGVKNKGELVKRTKPSFSTPPVKSLLNNTKTSQRGTKSSKNVLTKLQRGGNTGSFRGALGQSFGSRHESVDYTSSPHTTSKPRILTRELSQGPSSRRTVKGGFKKASSFGGRSNLSIGGGSYGGVGSFGNLHPPSISGTRVWK